MIVGENKVGKSNFLQALRLVLDPSLPDSARQLRAEDFWDGLQSPMKTRQIIEVVIELMGFADDPEMKAVYPVTIEMERRAKVVKEHPFENSGYVIMEDAESRLRWVKRVY